MTITVVVLMLSIVHGDKGLQISNRLESLQSGGSVLQKKILSSGGSVLQKKILSNVPKSYGQFVPN
jgi:hypothetical protein